MSALLRHSFFRAFPSNLDSVKHKIIVNFGPQHPAAHGVLRLVAQLSGERIDRLDVHIGLLHRSTEFLITTKHYEKSIPYFDRLDYVSMLTQEHAFCLVMENLLSPNFYMRDINYLRILFDELTRILNHLLAVSCHALDVGNMSCLFWCFELREEIMGFYEQLSGARMHAAFHTPFINKTGVVTKKLIFNILNFVKTAHTTINEIHNLLTYNKIWKQRLINVGIFSSQDAHDAGLTGVMARSTGIKRDLRLSKFKSYSGYNTIKFKSYTGINGDCYDRYLIRMSEIGESLNIIGLMCNTIKQVPVRAKWDYTKSITNLLFSGNLSSRSRKKYTTMESTILEFVRWHSGIFITRGAGYIGVESPKGEFGVSLYTTGGTRPQRCKIRSPSYHNLQFLQKLGRGSFLADLTTLIGTIDIVFGEIDR